MKKNKYTLISCLGQGIYDENDKGKYKQTTYIFEDGTNLNYSVFSECLINYYSNDLDSIIVVGTYTSSWNAIIPDYDSSNFDLYEKAYCEIKNGAINLDTLRSIEDQIVRNYKVKCKLLVHSAELNRENVSSLIDVYTSIYGYIEKNTKLILDITNGLRFMPMLMYQGLQYHSNEFSLDDVIVLYGELHNHENYAIVRDVSTIWSLAEINKQVYAFQSSFDGFALGETLKKNEETKRIGFWITEFSDMIKKNFVMRIDEILEKLKPILQFYTRKKDEVPSYVRDIISFLENMYKELMKSNRLSDKLLSLAWILNNKNLTTQSLISLRESIATRLIEKYSPNQIGYYVNLLECSYYQAFVDNCKAEGIYDIIHSIFALRNNIAHAGTKTLSKNGNEIKNIKSYSFDDMFSAVQLCFGKII